MSKAFENFQKLKTFKLNLWLGFKIKNLRDNLMTNEGLSEFSAQM